jgi:cell wall-associated NlpC family hydrolase
VSGRVLAALVAAVIAVVVLIGGMFAVAGTTITAGQNPNACTRPAAQTARACRSNLPATSPVARTAIDYARAQLGLPYLWGGDGPAAGDSGFDCSGLTRAAYAAARIALPRTAQTQYETGPLLPPGSPLLPGDLVFYGTPTAVHHVGLYIGDNLMINAPHRGAAVRIEDYHWSDYLAATRPGHPSSTPAPRSPAR